MTYLPETAGTLSQGAHPGSYNGQDAYDNKFLAIQDVRGVRDKKQNGIGITGDGPMYTLDSISQHAIANSAAVRRLTPTECERLQGFPDGWTATQSDSVRYRQLGNAVCVPVAEWIGRRIHKEG